MNKKLLFLLPAALLALTGCNPGGNASSGSESASESGSGSGSGSSGSESSGSESSGGGETTNYGTLEAPLTVAQALVIVKAEATVDYYSASGDKADAFTHQPVYVSGLVSSLSTVSDGKYSFDLKDSLSDAEGLVGFNLALADGVAAAYQNDTVTLYGYLENFKSAGVTKYEVSTYNEVVATVKTRTVGSSTITVSGEHASVEGLGASAQNGSTLEFTVAPDADYVINKVRAYGQVLEASAGTYSFVLVGNVEVEIEAIPEGETPASDTTVTFSSLGLENGVQYNTLNHSSNSEIAEGLSFAFGDGSNDGKYYNTGSAIRVYGGGHMTVSFTGMNMSKIILTFGSGEGSNAITASVGSYADGTWTGSASSVTFNVGGTSGHRRIATVYIEYKAA